MKLLTMIVLITNFSWLSSIYSASLVWQTRPLAFDIQSLLERNLKWATSTKAIAPNFLHNLAIKQTPKIMWIGCSDSRVPETKIFGAEPGEFFVHRSIANIVHQDDLGLISAVEYAVKDLQVDHIIICGHYKCGGVQAALKSPSPELKMLNKWIEPVAKLNEVLSSEEAQRTLVRHNIHRSVQEIMKLDFVDEAMNSTKRSKKLQIHPWVYDLEDGLIDIMEDGTVEIGSGIWYTNFGFNS